MGGTNTVQGAHKFLGAERGDVLAPGKLDRAREERCQSEGFGLLRCRGGLRN